MHKISDEFEFRPDRTIDYGVSCPWGLKISHRLIMGKWCLHASSFIFYRIIIKVAGNQDRHKSSDEFYFGPLVSMAHLHVFWNERMSSSACGWSKDLFFQYLLDWPSLLSNLPVTRTTIKAQTGSNFRHICPLTSELPALEHWKKYCGHDSGFEFWSDLLQTCRQRGQAWKLGQVPFLARVTCPLLCMHFISCSECFNRTFTIDT